MKTSIMSILITLLILSACASTYVDQEQNQFQATFLFSEGGERLGSDLNLEENEPLPLAYNSPRYSPDIAQHNAALTSSCLPTLNYQRLSIRAPPVSQPS